MWRLASASVKRRVLSGSQNCGRNNFASSLTRHGRFAAAVNTDEDWRPRSDAMLPIKSSGSIRYFSRRPKDHLDDPNEEILEEKASQDSKESEGSVAAWDMEFFDDQLTSGNDDPGYNNIDDDDDEELAARMDEEYRLKQEEIQRELDTRTGRPWQDPWAIQEEQWMSTTTFDDLPDWSPDRVSRISQERVQVLPDGIPTLSTLASLSLPPPASPHPGVGQAKAYAKYRKQEHYRYVAEQVKLVAKNRVEAIVKMSDWNEKQDAVDELFESTIEELKAKEEILGKHPEFAKWVERGLEDYLRTVNKSGGVGEGDAATGDNGDESSTKDSLPVFMDTYNAYDGEKAVVPTILSPLQPHRHDGTGRMVEEWEIAANKKTKRIMARDCTKSIAKILEEQDSSRIFVHGRRGVGKTAVLASIVASARKSGHIVLYLPDGDRLRKNGFFVTPNAQREGMFDLQNLSQEACEQLLASHADDLAGMEADKATMEYYFKDTQLKRIPDYSGDSMSLLDLLNYAKERKNHAPMCYSITVDRLMNQEEKPFLIVMDEFNCYYDHGHYFHMAYDEDVREAIPYENINLFEHAKAAMSLSTDEDVDDEEEVTRPKTIKRGAVIVGTTESHAVRRTVSDSLAASAQSQVGVDGDSPMYVVEVPRFSSVEVEHILANFECIGLGKLRLDRGDTVMNEQEVSYLQMASGSVGQKLLDVSVL